MNLDVTLMQYHPFLFKSVSFVFHNPTTPTLSKIEGHNFYLSGGGYYDGLVKMKKKNGRLLTSSSLKIFRTTMLIFASPNSVFIGSEYSPIFA